MSKTAVITTRVDPELKANAEDVLGQLGMTTAQAITMFLKQVEINRGLPFAPKLPSVAEQAVNTDSKPFTLETFSLGDANTPSRDDLYAARGR